MVREHTLASIMSDILDQRLISKPRCAEEKVKVLGILGQGMQGKVMLGLWKGVKVAYKVVQLPIAMSKHDNAHARALLEMAISATMAHPNVVQTYSYEMVHIEPTSDNALVGDASTDAAEIIDSTQVGNDEDAGRFDPVLEDVDSCSAREAVQSGIHEARLIQAGCHMHRNPAPSCWISSASVKHCMGPWDVSELPQPLQRAPAQELCDSKTLRYNLDNKKLVLSGEEFPHLGLALMLANDIACGMQHIHSQNIIHGDLKALNVLLTSSTRKTYYKETMLPNLLAKVGWCSRQLPS